MEPWLKEFADRLPEEAEAHQEEKVDKWDVRKKLLHGGSESESPYERLAWWIYENITSRLWFEGFILLNILLIGIATGVDLENSSA